jgi:EAL domain-containing protein (putative c-di-GMP-specific phosphodiesterase class I)
MSLRGCRRCAENGAKGFERPFTMAFQPIYDVRRGEIFAHEALVRPPGGGSAAEVLAAVTEENRYSFDQACRVKAIELAARLGLREGLSINFMPNAVYDPDACIAKTLWAAERHDIPVEAIIFEFTESEVVDDIDHLRRIVDRYRARGFRTAFDDFGAGHSGLVLLAALQPDIIKLDMKLLRGIDADPVRQAIVRNLKALTDEIGVVTIAEGIETAAECAWVVAAGIDLVQGYHLARPSLEALVEPHAIADALTGLPLAS